MTARETLYAAAEAAGEGERAALLAALADEALEAGEDGLAAGYRWLARERRWPTPGRIYTGGWYWETGSLPSPVYEWMTDPAVIVKPRPIPSPLWHALWRAASSASEAIEKGLIE